MKSKRYDRLARVAALKPVREAQTRAWSAATESSGTRAAPSGEADRLETLLGAERQRNHYGEHLEVRKWFAEPAACPASARALRLLAPHVPSGDEGDAHERLADPAHWLFLDTETTGLAGGTGTYAFLVGVAWWDAGGLRVEQFFMRDFSEEHSMLLALGERLAERRVLVTFNGKSFDWPLLETRYRMTRQISPRAPRAHLDLLHPARQLWRLHLASLRLTELERHVLGWDRGPDLWSQMIPQIYFDYLRGGPVEPLVEVFRHNQMDLRGLAALAGRIVSLLECAEQADGDALELYGVGKLLRRRGELPTARAVFERALGAGLPRSLDRVARRELARLAKRERDFARATALWKELIGERLQPSRAPTTDNLGDTIDAYEQLAIYYEHQAREPERAAELTRAALADLRAARCHPDAEPSRLRRMQVRLEHRLRRVTQKSGRPMLEQKMPG